MLKNKFYVPENKSTLSNATLILFNNTKVTAIYPAINSKLSLDRSSLTGSAAI